MSFATGSHWDLGTLIERLEIYNNKNKEVPVGLGEPHSYRGHYEDVAFSPETNITVREMLENAKSALGETFTGYKGGEFKMDEDTPVWIAPYGQCGEMMGGIMFRIMVDDEL